MSLLALKRTHLASVLIVLLLTLTIMEYCAGQKSYSAPMNLYGGPQRAPPGTHVKVGPTPTARNIWIASYYVPSSPDPHHTRIWQIVHGTVLEEDLRDMAISELRIPYEAPPLPSSIRSAFSFTYTVFVGNFLLYTYLSVGGDHASGAPSPATMDYYFTADQSGIGGSYNSYAFPPFPYEVSGAVMATDTTAPLKSDPAGNANASTYLFGGENSTHVSSTMYFSYSPPGASKPTEWIEIEPESEAVPAARMDAASVQKDGFWYLFGGRNSTGSFGDMWQFEFRTRKWTLLADSGYITTPAPGSPASSPETRGKPSPRYGHAMALVNPSYALEIYSKFILLAGGTNGETYYGDAWVFNLETKSFSRIDITDRPYEPRAWLGLFADSTKPRVYFYGGNNKQGTLFSEVYKLDFDPETGASSRISPSSVYLLIIALLALIAYF